MLGEAAQMWILSTGDGAVSTGFGLAGDDPAFQLARQFLVTKHRVDGWKRHRFLAQCCEPDRSTAAGSRAPSELMAHVDAEVVHDHGHAGRAGAVRDEDGEEGNVRMVGVAGVIEEPRLIPFATADV